MNFKTVSVLSLAAWIAMEVARHAPSAFCQESRGPHNNTLAHESKTYELIWSDEFNQTGPPNPENWTFEHGFSRNRELQWYQPENAVCENGKLIISAKRERVSNPNFVSGAKSWKNNRQYAEYTSACVTTQGLHSWTFGRVEVCARIDAREGLWPAIWTLGEEGYWPDRGEIDIMEYYRGHLLANACWRGDWRWTPQWEGSKRPLIAFEDEAWASRFHTWRMDWDEEQIELFVDDTLLNNIALAQTIRKGDEGSRPFHQPHFLLFNLAIGGNQGGDPSATEFPATFEVDYVRVYQR